MSDREAMKLALKALEAMQSYAAAERKGLRICDEAIEALRAALAAPRPEPVRHPGYVIGSHWFETAYERLCAGEAEDAILEDYELVREPRLRDLRRDAERYRWLRGEHSRIDPCIKANAKYKLERQSSTWVEIHDLDAAIDAAMQEDKT
jgi:hypothetical protein